MRVGLQRNYKQDFRRNILPIMGDMELNGVTVDTLESFRIHLVDERGFSLKDGAQYHRRFTSSVSGRGTADRS